ncbi:glycoside hydrolase family 25 protein [Clostridium sp. Marseille-P2415]|uniref:glycoside hydrolase family 25 protein n=1 Tax=Clostridium sp. Marseille-P2415 TaxID=1805471 RepID=UPI0009883E28|nr:glycoside hydrolase family 25 protein [Clostridium sp. Marseille-P2415]
MKKNIRLRIGACLAAGLMASAAMAEPMNGFSAEAWNLENGQYVDASGNPIAGALEKGITVSKYQNRQNAESGGIDWNKVALDGVSFAMVRIGYFNDRDPYYSINMTNAAASGIKTGVFFYTQALDTQTAVEEARYVLRMVKDYSISYPIAYDVESKYLLDNNLSKQQITDNINAFCKTVADAGYRPIVYANNKWLTNYIDMSQIPYDVWYARYGTVNNCRNRTMWQCTDQGRVDGIDGDVTIEFSFVDYSSMIPPEGWKIIDGNWYYTKNYVKQTGWIQVEGIWYYLDLSGIMIHDTAMVIDGVSYTFGPDGAVVR